MSLALQGGFLTTGPPGKPVFISYNEKLSENVSVDLEEQLSEMPKPNPAMAKFGFLALLIDEIEPFQGSMGIDYPPYRH